MRAIRFDVKSERQERLETVCSYVWGVEWVYWKLWKVLHSKNELMHWWTAFHNKSRLRFTHFMGNKPDKFGTGIKFWLLKDANTKYLINGFPYLRKDVSRPQGVNLGHHVVLKLLQGLEGKSYNLTVDNFFMSLNLCNDLKKSDQLCWNSSSEQTRAASHEFSIKTWHSCSHDLFIHLYKSNSEVTLTAYKEKRSKVVLLMSSLHSTNIAIDEATEKRQPETILKPFL